MQRRVTIPVRIQEPAKAAADALGSETDNEQRQQYVGAPEPRPARVAEQEAPAASPTEAAPESVPAEDGTQDRAGLGTLEEWRTRALRLMAERDNYRKRQQRLAQDQIEEERQRLLGAFLPVVDDLERALATPRGDDEALRQGIRLTHQAALQLLRKEGVEPIEAQNQIFDPNWHEAVATTGRNGTTVQPSTVVNVVQTGYRSGDKLLRPAKVIVAL